MGLDVKKWDERIVGDLKYRIANFDHKWLKSIDLINNESDGTIYGNLTKEFASSMRARLIAQNFMVNVGSDDPDHAKSAEEIQIMANSLARSVNLKGILDNASEAALYANTGWIEVGHTLDFHSFDPHRSLLLNVNKFNPADTQDEFVEVPAETVAAQLGDQIDDVAPFDATEPPPPIQDAEEASPMTTFDPDFGKPWIKDINPLHIVLPRKNKDPNNAEYITKLMVLSVEEAKLLSGDVSGLEWDKINSDESLYRTIYDTIDDHEFIDNKVVIAITFIRIDRNDPDNNGSYLVHILNNPSFVIKESVNPFGGMVPFIPIKGKHLKKTWAKSWVEDLTPYTMINGKLIESVFDKASRSLTNKWFSSSSVTIGKDAERKLNDPNYSGRIKIDGNPDHIKSVEIPKLDQSTIALLNLVTGLAQGEAAQTDLDRGVPVKKITARQTEALLKSSDILIELFRTPVARAASETILKLIHILSLFNPPDTAKVYSFAKKTVSLNPNGADYTTSYRYEITTSDMGGASSSEAQLLWTSLLKIIGTVPGMLQNFDIRELANETRRIFGVGSQIMAPVQPPGIPGESPDGDPNLVGPAPTVLEEGGGHSPLDQGGPGGSLSGQLAGGITP